MSLLIKEGVEFTTNQNKKLSSNQKEILNLYTIKNLTVNQIAITRQITDKAVYKTLSKLKKKGVLKRLKRGGLNLNQCTQSFQPPSFKKGKQIRLHGQEFNIKLLHIPNSYERLIKTKNLFYFKDNTIRLYSNSIEVYANPKLHFWGDDIQVATSKSFKYWNNFFHELQDRFGFLIIKGANTKIKQVNAHYSEVENELAEDSIEKKVNIQIRATEDNKVWFIIDNSYNLKEAEFIKPETAKQDGERIVKHFNEIRDNNIFSPLEVHQAIQDLTQNSLENAQLLKGLILTIDKLNLKVDEMI